MSLAQYTEGETVNTVALIVDQIQNKNYLTAMFNNGSKVFNSTKSALIQEVGNSVCKFVQLKLNGKTYFAMVS